MGAPDLLAKHVFSEELPALFHGAVTFRPGMDLGLAELRLDGVLVVLQPLDLSAALPPWSLLRRGYIVVEVKMPGDHTDEAAFERHAHLAALDLPGLEALRAHLKTYKDWPRP